MLLETMRLSGMMSKNTIVLLDPINLKIEAGGTVSGFIPLLQDIFWVGMDVTIMVGINILTMIMVPVLYATLYRIKSPGCGV